MPEGGRRKSALLEEQNQQLKKAKERHALNAALAERGGGLLLRGWRRELDPDGSMDVPYKELDWHLRRLGLELSAKTIVDKDAEEISLEELSPADGHLVNRIRNWIKDAFGSPANMWTVIDVNQAGNLDREGWVAACMSSGFEGTAEELSYLFDFIDIDESGQVNKEEVLFLERDSQERDKAIFEEKMKSRGQMQRLWASVYWSELHKKQSPLSRLAPRPWLATSFESLPPLVIVKRQHRLREVRNRQQEAKTLFLQSLSQKYGSCARAWRRGIDTDGKFCIDKLILRNFCRRHELDTDVHIQSLWSSLDSDKDGKVCLQDVSPLGAVALASFRAWCRQKCGSCRAVWYLEDLVNARSRPQKDGMVQMHSDKKMLICNFTESLKVLGCKCKGDQAEMLSALDFFNAGFISEEPPLFLTAQPSEEEWASFKSALLERYGSPLNAWRQLDLDGQNEVSWMEFVAGCRRMRFKGDTGAAWRYIDNDASGYISMEEFSRDHYKVLMSFKQWASGLYGSVASAFKNFDKEGDGTLTLSILRRSCQKGKWDGDPQTLFDCVGASNCKDPSKKLITIDDVSFLDVWPDREERPDEGKEQEDTLTRTTEKEERIVLQSKSAATLDVFSRLYTPRYRKKIAKNIDASPTAYPVEKAAQIQRTYHCCSLPPQRRPKTAQSMLPIMERIHQISAFYREREANS
ncbi:unnamed protein product [Effrenium voratum]|uniref:EF-hand domain-containing protein n=1 Tax=Effrenium voratum TaxID=2562239 RepID=A0AA36HNH1_9DINO|nr:unnamed protein product [Effrenium voratum]